MSDGENRRPLKARGWVFMQSAAVWLNKNGITPNQISIASIVFSALAGGFLLLLPIAGPSPWLFMALVLLSLAGRGICNITDGLVAIEGGRATASGELFNDIPDRLSDVLILVAAGYAAGQPTLGWLASLLSVMTAYTRTLARSIGAPADFRGPMAKLQRMLLVSGACVLMPLELALWHSRHVMSLTLIIISIGCVWTIWNRARSAYRYLEQNRDA